MVFRKKYFKESVKKMKLRRIVSLFMVCAIILAALFAMPVSADEANLTIGTMKGWGWINKGGSTYVSTDYEVNTERTQVADTLVPSYGYAWTGTFDFFSVDGTLTGPAAGKDLDVFGLQWTGVSPDPAVDTVMFYVELPDFAKSGATWALGLNGVAIVQNETDYWVNQNYDAEYSYLSVTGDSWKTDVIKGGSDGTTRYFNGLPSGFKGYIRVNFENFTYRADVDLDSAYTINYFYLTLNSLGGDCGGLTFGGIMYVPSNDSNSLTMEYSGQTFQLSTGEGDAPAEPVPPSTADILVSTMKGWNWINKGAFSLPNTQYTTDGSQTQVACTQVPSYGYAWDGTFVFSSKDGSLTGPIAEKDVEKAYFQWAGVAIDPAIDTMIFYVELPDYEKSGATWALGLNGLGVKENGTEYWVNMNNDVAYSYLSIYGDSWVDATIKGGASETERYFQGLPSGFKGYIRLNFENFTYWSSDVNLDNDYTWEYLYLSLNSIGGECGDMRFGGITYVPTNNTNGLKMKVGDSTYDLTVAKGGDVTLVYNDDATADAVYSDKYVGDVITLPTPEREGYSFGGWYYDDAFANAVGATYTVTAESKTLYANWIKNIEIGDVDADGVIDATDLTVLRKIILEAEADYDAAIADVNGDGEIDVRDLVRLKKSVA